MTKLEYVICYTEQIRYIWQVLCFCSGTA